MKTGPKPKRVVTRFLARIRPQEDGCLYWSGYLSPNGYGTINIKGDMHYAHRVAWELKYDKIPERQQVNHTCHVRHCVNPDHMYLGTQADNMRDKAELGSVKGTNHSQSKLTEEQVLAIRADTRSLTTIAAEYGVSFPHVSDIKNRKKWTHLP